jgi:hypothetical protein
LSVSGIMRVDVEDNHMKKMYQDIYTTCTDLSDEDVMQYVELEIGGQSPREQLPEVGAHLDACADCAERYEDLLEMLRAEKRGEIPAAVPGRPFDLTFLSSSPPALWKRVTETLSRLDHEITLAIGETMAALDTLGQLLTPLKVSLASRAVRDVREPATEIEGLRIPDETAGLVFTLIPGPVEAGGTRFTLIVQVDDLTANTPAKQVRVNLHDPQGELLQSERTDAQGRVVFRGLAGSCIIRCRHAGQTWEFPIAQNTATSALGSDAA